MVRPKDKLFEQTIFFHDRSVPEASLTSQITRGLRRTPKTIAPKFFYDQRGSELFDAICKLPEYYLTRADVEIIDTYADAIAQALGANIQLVEFGSGSSLKVQLLLDAVQPEIYMPIDISKEHLVLSCQSLARKFPWLTIHAVCTDYSTAHDLPYYGSGLRLSGFFPGSSIGNFEPAEASRFLANVKQLLGPGGAFIVGVDVKKDPAMLEAAYNDKQGITAAFNLNVLARINAELGADIDVDQFEHQAHYNADLGRIEMHLVSRRAQDICIDGEIFHFDALETIHTECSYKYSIGEFQDLARRSGIVAKDVWTDDGGLFSVHLLEVPLAH